MIQWSPDHHVVVWLHKWGAHDTAEQYAVRSHGFKRCVIRSRPCWVTYYEEDTTERKMTIVVDDTGADRGLVLVQCNEPLAPEPSLCPTILGTLRPTPEGAP